MFTHLLKIFRKNYSTKERHLFAQLQQTSLFSQLCFEELAPIVPLLHVRNYTYNESIFSRNEPAQAIYVLVRGEVQASIHRFGKEETLFMVSAGETLGHEGILPRNKRLYNATVSSEEALVYAIPHPHFQEILESNSQISAKIMCNLAVIYKEYIRSLYIYYEKDAGFFELVQIKQHL